MRATMNDELAADCALACRLVDLGDDVS